MEHAVAIRTFSKMNIIMRQSLSQTKILDNCSRFRKDDQKPAMAGDELRGVIWAGYVRHVLAHRAIANRLWRQIRARPAIQPSATKRSISLAAIN